MPRRSQGNPLPLLIATLLLALVALLPLRIMSWVSVFRGPVMTIIAPIAGPLSALATWLRDDRVDPATAFQQSTLDALSDERDRLARQYLHAIARIDELEALLEDMQRMTARRSSAVRQIEARRVGVNLGAGTVDYDRGSLHGVSEAGVAVSRRGEQLVGQITRLSPTVATAHLITNARRDAPLMVGVIIPADTQGEQLPPSADALRSLKRCQLRAQGDGTLVDQQFGVGLDEQSPVAIGDVVRLLDESWPSSAQMAVLGRVIAIEPTEQPLFRVLRVAPIVDIQRLRSVIVLSPLDGPVPVRGPRGNAATDGTAGAPGQRGGEAR